VSRIFVLLNGISILFIFLFLLIFVCDVSSFMLTANGLQLAEGGDFQQKFSYEAPKFIYPQNCPTKHETATFGKVLLQAGVLSFVSPCVSKY